MSHHITIDVSSGHPTISIGSVKNDQDLKQINRESSKQPKKSSEKGKEWERERRNKFNQAIANLWDTVKAVNKENNFDLEVTQCSKVEVVQRAVIIITNLIQEKSNLKAEILSIQVELERKKQNKKDESTQTKVRKQSKKHTNVKLVVTKKDEQTLISKSIELPLVTTEETPITSEKNMNYQNTSSATDNQLKAHGSKSVSKNQTTRKPEQQSIKPKAKPIFTKILPMTTAKSNQKGSESTFVVLPAAPYIIPQRQFLFPALPQTFVLLNPNIQSVNKPNIQTLNRTNNDITKTTMVNILPISAYSRPMSAYKPKRIRSSLAKKKVKLKSAKNNHGEKSVKEQDINKENSDKNTTAPDCTGSDGNSKKQTSIDDIVREKIIKDPDLKEVLRNSKSPLPKKENSIPATTDSGIESKKNKDSISEEKSNLDEKEKHQTDTPLKNTTHINSLVSKVNLNNRTDTEKPCDEKKGKENKVELPGKHDKLPSILENPLCINSVEGGNARLELAEELLAASPTAAFLMSFPLVSGNRADSPADESHQIAPNVNSKNNEQKRNDESKEKSCKKILNFNVNSSDKNASQQRLNISSNITNSTSKQASTVKAVFTEPSLLNLQTPSVLPSSCPFGDPLFTSDFDCNVSKTFTNATSYMSNTTNAKSDSVNNMKNSVYSTSNIASGADFNSLGLYPCAIDKFAPKSKDFAIMEENLMKIGSSRLTYDIDLGWSHKGLDFISCSANNVSITKENIITTVSSSYSTSYNPFNPEFHMPLVTNAKRDQVKPISTLNDNMTNFYPQNTGIWSEDVPFYTNTNLSLPKAANNKSFSSQTHLNQPQMELNKQINSKVSHSKNTSENIVVNNLKTSTMEANQLTPDKYSKKATTNKMHINWMTSEIRPNQAASNSNVILSDFREQFKPPFNQFDQSYKKTSQSDGNYFPINVHNFSTHNMTEEFQSWTPTKTHGTTEISIDPPPLNLPTLVGDLALGPHERKKQTDINSRPSSQADPQNCNSFLSVTQLMNPTAAEIATTRGNSINTNLTKGVLSKQNFLQYENKSANFNNHSTNTCYNFNDSRIVNSYDSVNHFPPPKPKANKDKITKTHKNNYSAESLMRGAPAHQKSSENKFIMPSQKYGNYNPQSDTNVAQVSHFPSVLDYSDSSYSSQQFSGTTLYNATTNTISNSFYNNFMPGSSNIMTGSYSGHTFTGDIDYNQTNDCNYNQQKYEEFKMKISNAPEKSSNHNKNNKKEPSKHKLECSKKESSKRYQSKKAKITNEVDNNWGDPSMLWQNKMLNKRSSNAMGDDIYPNYMGNQMSSHYQADIFNNPLMTANMQSAGHVDRSISTFPPSSRANFNLSTIFPEIAMKVQS